MSELQKYLDALEKEKLYEADIAEAKATTTDIPETNNVSSSDNDKAIAVYMEALEKENNNSLNQNDMSAYVESQNLDNTAAPVPYTPSTGGKKTLTQLENTPKFAKIANRFLESVGENDDIFEYLRDSDYSLTSAALRAVKTNSWTKQQASDYTYLREQFDNAELSGFKERFNFVKDFSIDVLTDPINILAGIFSIPTLGGSIATRGALAIASKQGLKKLTASQLGKRKALRKAKTLKGAKRGAKLGAIEGAAWAGPHEYFLQDIDVDLGNRDEIDLGVVAGVTALGGVFGGTIGGGLAAASAFKRSKYLTEKKFKHTNENEIEIQGNQPRKEVLENSRLKNAVEKVGPIKEKTEKGLYWFIANSVGKPTTQFLNRLKDSPKLEEFLSNLRYDYDSSLYKKTKSGVKQQTYGELLTDLYGSTLGVLSQTTKNLDRAGIKKGRFRIATGNKLTPESNDQLARLLRNEKTTINNVEDLKDITGGVKEAYITIKKLLNKTHADLVKAGALPEGTGFVAGYLPRLFNYSALMKNRTKFEKMLIEAGHAKPSNFKEFVSETQNVKTGEVIRENTLVRSADPGLDVKTFGIDFIDTAKKQLEIEGVAPTSKQVNMLAEELKATKIVDDMLDYKYTPFELKASNAEGSATGFLNPRRFTNLKDNDIAEFLENDVEIILQKYFTNTSQVIARSTKFGKNMFEIEARYIKPIADQLKKKNLAAGMSESAARSEAESVAVSLRKMVKTVTGLKAPRINNKAVAATNDAILLSQQLAHLAYVTISSATEPLLLFSRAAVSDAPLVARDIATSIAKEVGNSLDATIRSVRRMRGKTTKDADSFVGAARLKLGLKELDNADWQELYKAGLGLEQAVQERLAGLVGESMQTSSLKRVSNGFFKLTFLTQWTKAVQLASFTTGKRLILQRAKALSEHRNGAKLIKLSGDNRYSTKRYYERQLEDLGVDPNEAMAWYEKSLNKNGVYNQTKGESQAFYNDTLTPGASRFTQEIILNPSTSQANRPLWFSHPAARLLTQFAGYPTVFGNTILKRWVNESVNHPLQALPKIAITTVAMTTVAHLLNTLRSGGENLYEYKTGEEKEPVKLAAEGIRRFGGFGLFDYATRYERNIESGRGGITSVLKTFAGPFPQDIIDAVSYDRGGVEVLAQNIPFYQVLPSETRKALRKAGRDFDKGPKEEKVKKKKPKKKETPYVRYEKSKGGIVYDVPNASVEPDERIDKITGVPYDEQAGVIMRDEEERGVVSLEDLRLGFDNGGEATARRADGSLKSQKGFLGPIINNETGGIQTELSITFDDVLGGRPVPLLVPTLTEEEVKWFKNNNAAGNPQIVPSAILQKAIRHARERDKQGLDPFYKDGEETRESLLSPTDAVKAALDSAIEQHAKMLYVAEGKHGFTKGLGYSPAVSKDAKDKASGKITYDIGYGHKITADEWASGEIHGIPFTSDDGEIYLDEENVRTIMRTDIRNNLAEARRRGWDAKLAARNTSWDELTTSQQTVLQDVSYNVGASKAASAWDDIFDYLGDTPEDRKQFIKNSRRKVTNKDSGKLENTAGMDNRAAQAAYAAGYITTLKQAHAMGLDLATTIDGEYYPDESQAKQEEQARQEAERKAAAAAEAKRKAEAERLAEAELAALQQTEETERVAALPSTQDGVPPSSDTVEPLANEPQFNRANVNQGGLVNVLYKRSQRG